MKRYSIIFAIAVIGFAASMVIADSAPTVNPPANMSIRGLADWAFSGGHISSGTGALPPAGINGSRYVDLSTPSAPIEYLSDGSAWHAISSGGGGGTTDHSALNNLPYAQSGHTGFAASTDVPNNASFTLAGLGAKPFSAITDKPTTLSGYGITDAASDNELSAHAADQTDPHGASMTVSESIAVGTGDAEDAYISRLATGVVMIASYSYLPPTSATPSADIATGTIWYDSNVNKLKCYDGSAWQDLW